jgi:hypothetical protein
MLPMKELKLIYDWQSVGQSVLSGTRDHFFFLLEISFRQLRPCCFVAPFLTRGWVCNLLYNCFWAEVPQNSRPYFTVSSETPLTWRARFPHLYSPGTGWPSYTPGHWVRFLSLLTTRRDYGGRILTHLHTGYVTNGVGIGVLEADSQSTSSSGYRASLRDPWPDFILLFFLRLAVTLFFFRRRLLWWENGSVVYSAITR